MVEGEGGGGGERISGRKVERTHKQSIEYHIYLSFFFLLFFKAAHRWPMDGASERRRELKGSIGKERERERESTCRSICMSIYR